MCFTKNINIINAEKTFPGRKIKNAKKTIENQGYLKVYSNFGNGKGVFHFLDHTAIGIKRRYFIQVAESPYDVHTPKGKYRMTKANAAILPVVNR